MVKRFWKRASARPAGDAFEVLLDERPLRTPARQPLLLPNRDLAEAIADEWRQAADDFTPAGLPLTALANAATDIVAADRPGFLEPLVRYTAFDLLCYRAEHPAALVARQQAIWEPLVAAVEAHHALVFHRSSGILHVEQPAATLATVRTLLAACSNFELAALQPLFSIGGSAILALAHRGGLLDADAAFAASRLDEDFQQQQWGADAEAARASALHQQEFRAAARFLALANLP